MINSVALVSFLAGALIGLLFGAPRKLMANVVFEPRRSTELLFWPLIGAVALGLVGLRAFSVMQVQWIPVIVGLFGGRAVVLLFASIAIKKGLLPERILRLLYVLRLHREHPYEPNVRPEFVRETLAEKNQVALMAPAYMCARLSWIAYQDDAAVQQCAREWGLEGERVVKENLAFVWLHDSQSIVIAFQGTNDIRDWLHNLDGRPRQTEWGTAHTGFDAAAESLWAEVSARIRSTRIANPTIWLTGHSLGGAIAQLTAVRLSQSDMGTLAGIFTFGQPAVGALSFCSAFQQRLGERMCRFISCRDEVPQQPPGYVQTGRLLYFDRKGRLHEQPNFSFMFRDQMCQETRGLIEEHGMVHYLRLVESIVLYGIGHMERVDQKLWESWRRRVEQQRDAPAR